MGDFVQGFLNSSHGQRAFDSLTGQGINPADAQKYLQHAAQAGADHAHEHAQNHGLLGEHAGRNFFAAFAAGIVKGDGFFASLGDGFEGLIVGRITEYLCNRAGVDPNIASTVAATAAPFVISYMKEHLGGSE